MARYSRRIWGWMLFDVAQQPYATLGLTFIFGPYFAAVAAQSFLASGAAPDAAAAAARSQSLWGTAQTLAGLVIALTAPFLGAWADASGRKVAWIVGLSAVYLPCAWAMWFLLPDGTHLLPVLALFWIGFVAGEAALNINNAQLPSLAPPERIGRISGTGSAIGYWGGVASLFAMLLFLAESPEGTTLLGNPPAFGLDPALREGTRSVGPFVAIWFAVFIVPFLLWVRDPAAAPRRPSPREVWRDLGATVRDTLRRPSLASFLGSSMLYRDGLGALYSFGGVYATLVLGWDVILIGLFGITAAIAAAVLTWVGGLMDERLGPKPVIVASCWALIVVCTVIVGVSRESVFGLPLPEGSRLPDILFFVCGGLIGGAGGASYSASRTLMVLHADPGRAGEAFGLFALTGRATAFLAPALIAACTAITGSAQLGFVPVIALFLLGLWLLRWTEARGDRRAPGQEAPR